MYSRESMHGKYGHNKTFLVPDSYRETEWDSNSISADVTDDASENEWCLLYPHS